MSKLQNKKAIRQMLEGTHRLQTRTKVGWIPKKDFKIREVGEIWEETLPDGTVVEWEQRSGYRRRRKKNMKTLLDLQTELKEYKNCYEDCEKRVTKNYSMYDEQIRNVDGMCLDCRAKFITDLKVKGEYEEYVRNKDLTNTLAFFEDAEKEKDILKAAFEKIEYVDEEGKSEKWVLEDKESFLKKIDDDFEKLRKRMLEPLLKK